MNRRSIFGFLRNPEHPKQWFLRMGPLILSSWPYTVKMRIHAISMSVEWKHSYPCCIMADHVKDGFYLWMFLYGPFYFSFCYNKNPYKAELI